jgi:hypothetical protein
MNIKRHSNPSAWKKGCSEKVRYYSAEAAKKALDRMREVHPGQTYKSYPCSFCGKFHVGTIRRTK